MVDGCTLRAELDKDDGEHELIEVGSGSAGDLHAMYDWD